ncbi:MAG: hypothetical protein A2Z14_10980 [Chloroflexi bacterium RBG_16_48_8]|nr:MAG: hypothetical protein A2Z14_10980 [Chloroflexi bacterium RBG_16_48_8]
MSPNKKYLFLRKEGEESIALVDCLDPGGVCPEPVLLDEIPWSVIKWSPDETMLVGSDRGDLAGVTTFWIYREPNWNPPAKVTEISGDWLPEVWCPDSRCFIVVQNLYPHTVYLVELDGDVSPLPQFDFILGAIRIP